MTPVPICSIRVGMVIAAGKAKDRRSCTAVHGEGTGTAAAREEKKQVSVFAIVVDPNVR